VAKATAGSVDQAASAKAKSNAHKPTRHTKSPVVKINGSCFGGRQSCAKAGGGS
jgi:hypothetical protein